MPFQSILTFDLREVPEDFEMPEDRTNGKRIGLWHGRVTMMPESPLADWSPKDITRAKTMAKRMVSSVGQLHVEFRDDKDVIHAYRWATISEVAQALRASEGRRKR